MAFRRQTIVEGEHSSFLIETFRGKKQRGVETRVFPMKAGELLAETAHVEDNKPKSGRRTHRELCQKYDFAGREYSFNPHTDKYEPGKDAKERLEYKLARYRIRVAEESISTLHALSLYPLTINSS